MNPAVDATMKTAPNITRLKSVPKPAAIPSTSSANIQSAPTATNQQWFPVSSSVPSAPPTIRVKAIESMKEKMDDKPMVNIQPQQPVVRPQQQHAVAKKRVTLPPVLKTTSYYMPKPYDENNLRKQSAAVTNQQPVKLWNNVTQKEQAPPSLTVHFGSTKNNLTAIIRKSPPPGNMKQYTNRANKTSSNPPRNAVPIVENAVDNASVLKINQVFEGVDDDFVEDLLHDNNSQASSSVDVQSPMFDNLVKEVVKEKQIVEPYTLSNSVKIIEGTDQSCLDYRCNICLTFNDSYDAYRLHVARAHGLNFTCDKCHSSFDTLPVFRKHFPCKSTANASRSFICIVDPPIILMKNKKVFAFRCKHCKDVAFQNQRNYVLHAQRHAQLFRCKRCPTKPLTMRLMKQHLQHHTP